MDNILDINGKSILIAGGKIPSYRITDIAKAIAPDRTHDVDELCGYLTANYDVRYYFDEPVSGYANFSFNRALKHAGANMPAFSSIVDPRLYVFYV